VNAQNQHYVPKHILRQFLSDENGERVTVYDKHEERTFVTSIKNVMAERRFNDFTFDEDWRVSFEPLACIAEDQVLPAYNKVLSERRLDGSPEQKAALALLMAFQFVRTKAHRDRWQDLEDMLRDMVEGSGGRMQDVQGWEDWRPSTEDDLKRHHLISIHNSLGEFARIIGEKDFLLAKAARDRSFYLGDNPVCLNNARDFGPYGNIGLGVPGIEIYLPLSSDLLLCAWCPSILEELRRTHAEGRASRRAEALAAVTAGRISAAQMRTLLDQIRPAEEWIETLLQNAAEGRPIDSNDDNMDYYNSLQTSYAFRYVICQNADFGLAKKHNREFPQFRKGRRMERA
jgi:hypothetical protein